MSRGSTDSASSGDAMAGGPQSPQSTAPSSQSSQSAVEMAEPHHHPAMEPPPQNLDDIFGSSPPQTTEQMALTAEPSDLPSLRRQHVTAGYRDGISVAKTAHVQKGFDAGFPVGAELGVRVGTVLGVLEGVVRADKGSGSGVEELYEHAKRELAVQKVFGAVDMEAGEGDGRPEGMDVRARLANAGEMAVAKWEDRVRSLLGDGS